MANQYAPVYCTDTEKQCSACKAVKPHVDFHKDKNSSRGLTSYCRVCANSKTRAHNRSRAADEDYKRIRREAYFKRKYKLTLEERSELLYRQQHRCAICRTDLPELGTLTHVDHDHATGKVRAILCTNCNRGLGHFKDSVELLGQAADYILKHRTGEE